MRCRRWLALLVIKSKIRGSPWVEDRPQAQSSRMGVVTLLEDLGISERRGPKLRKRPPEVISPMSMVPR